MALRKTFQEVIQAVRAEARLSTNTSRGIDHLDHIKQVVRRHYDVLCEDFEWEHLKLKKESAISRKQLQAGSRTYNFPTDVNPMRIERAWVKWGSVWLPLEYGVGYPQFTAYDPDIDQRADPITNWGFYGGDMFEVWPLPATDGVANGNNEVAFEGEKLPEQLVENESRLDMDDILVTMLAAAEILTENGQDKSAALKADLATSRLLRVRGNLGSKKRVRVGLGVVCDNSIDANNWPRHPTYIRG